MSKRKPTSKKKSQSKPTSKAPAPRQFAPPAESASWSRIFRISTLAGLVVLVALSLSTGINGDDEYQNDYSAKLVDYYSSFGADTAALNIPKGNMHLYGGFFDLVTGTVNAALGLEVDDAGYHQVRHAFNAIMGWLAMLFIALFVSHIAGPRAAVFAFVIAFLSPRFFGHSLMNPKDIPFAAGYIIALYFLFRILRMMPKPNWKLAAGLAAGFGLALATRAGGLLIVGYIGLFFAGHYLTTQGVAKLAQPKTWLPYLTYGLGAAVAGYILAVLFWPYALVNPISHPLEALTEFSNLGIRIRVLFEGENVMSDSTAWYYPLSWIVRTIPLIVLVGFLGSLFLYPKLTQRYGGLPVNLLLFTSLFPLFYIIYKDSLLHDGWRHLMFVYPGLVILATLFWLELEKLPLLQQPKWARSALYAVVGILLLLPTLFIVRNPHLSYVYFNEAFGGIQAAYGNYETDYWGVSVKEAIDWMEEEGIISPDMQDSVTIASSYSYILRKQLGDRYGDIVRVRYVKYSQRFSLDWDYAIFPARYVRGPHLRDGIWPSSKAIHVIEANGVPLAAILHAPTDAVFEGEQAVKQRNWPVAIEAFEREVADYPDNELAWTGLANAYLNSGRFPEAQNAADKVLEIVPQNLSGLYFRGLAKLNQGDNQGAVMDFQQTVEIDPGYSIGYYYLALTQQQRGDLTSALINLENAIKANPRFKAAYELAASIHEQQGNAGKAAELRQIAQRL
jgi:tetratricopeptide (TPR) repeat protein